MKTITFYSYKGGVGRTLALSNMASRLAEMGKKVCLLDFDLEAPGLHYKFNNYIKSDEISKGLVDYINDFISHGHSPKELKNYVSKISFAKRNKSDLNLIAAGGFSDDNYWKKLSKINWFDLLYEADSVGIKLFLQLKKRIEDELKPDYLLIDSRTGITDISGITLSLLADEVVLLSANNLESINGSKHVLKAILNEKNVISGKLPKIHFVLSRIPKQERNIDEDVLVENRKNELNDYLNSNEIDYQINNMLLIHSDRDLELKESFKIERKLSQKFINAIHPIYNDYIRLFESITQGDFSIAELTKFNNIKEAELLIEESIYEKNSIKKIDLLNKAISLDARSENAFYRLGQNYTAAGKLEEAIKSLEKAVKLNPSRYDIIYSLMITYCTTYHFKKAYNLIEKGLEIFPKDRYLLSSKALILTYLGKNDNAIKIYLEIIKLYKGTSIVYNNYGYALWKLGNVEEAIEKLYKSLEIEPTDGMTYATIGEVALSQKDYQEFYKNFEIAIKFEANIEKSLIDEFDLYETIVKEVRFQKILKRENIDWEMIKSKHLKRKENIRKIIASGL